MCYNGEDVNKEAFILKKRKNWIKWVILLLIAAAVAAGLWSLSSRTQSAAYREMDVTTGDLTTYYHFDGLVYAPRVQTISAGAQDIVDRVYVQQNQRVGEGDRLYATKEGGVVRADIDGELTGLFLAQGDVLTAGQRTAEIIDMQRLEVRLNVDEYDVGAVTPGTTAEITVLSRDASYTGSVTKLDKNGTASGDLSYYTATVALPQMEDVYPGMQVSARVLRGHVEGASILNMDALQFDEYNEPYVLVRDASGEVQSVSVQVGLSDGVYCEILSGVRAGDTVLVPGGMSMAELMQQMRRSARN